ncbi:MULTISPECIES: spore germination protein [Psychrobacillus]|uniref:Spore germination protein n=1 Tax=Psychrobacillus faecigallinarum TaxID=2762235 RepID=A0ABR8RDK5_9BACI|nr:MULTISPECIES: spore germination protein [Psychrobacillus]MBD7945809.1 spore germination protein [Psychrobacillus faecigallinarum]
MSKPNPPTLMNELSEKFTPSSDIIFKPLQMEGNTVFMFYLKSVVDGAKLHGTIIKPFFEMKSFGSYQSYVESLPDLTTMKSGEELQIEITKGHVLVAIEDEFYLIDIKLVNSNEVQQTLMEPTIYGPQLALSEDIETNLNIIRQRYHEPTLKFEMHQLKDKAHQPVAIIYDEKTVKQSVLKNVKEKLKNLDATLIQSAGDLQLHLNGSKITLFPTLILTERPDRISYNLAAGKVVVMINGSPHALIAPVVFFDFMLSMEDNYHTFWITTFTLILRYIGLIICLILPALYVAVTSYTPDVMRTELALTVAGSRLGVPYPSFIEVLFMLIFMEFLTEASIRLPKAISATATTVGGLILGTAATEAALTSNIMIIIVSAVAITSFVIPISEMSFSIRICRYMLIIYTTLFGTIGLILGSLGLVMFLANKRSFGEPYLKMYWWGEKKEIGVRSKG